MSYENNYPIGTPSIGDFLVYIDKMMNKTAPGKYFSISFNGESTITCSISGRAERTIEGIDSKYASKVEQHIKNKKIDVKKFRISPSAFEATFKRNKPAMR